MRPLLLAAALACAVVQARASQDDVQISKGLELKNPEGGESRLLVMTPQSKLNPPKLSPKQKWLFEWQSAGYAERPQPPGKHLRFRVFSQLRREQGDLAPQVARTLLRLYDYNSRSLGLDHSALYNGGIIDVYLCFGGNAGGEQLFAEDDEAGRVRKVNTIYIYDLASFARPIEMLREVAHEYGHATLPPFGTYTAPEDWANGKLGEGLYLQMLSRLLAEGRLSTEDVMGATAAEIDSLLRANFEPLWQRVASNGPGLGALRQRSAAALDQLVGLALYGQRIMSEQAFARALLLSSQKAEDLAGAMVDAIAERSGEQLAVPTPGRALWLPIGKARIIGGKVLQRASGWAKVQPVARVIRIERP